MGLRCEKRGMRGVEPPLTLAAVPCVPPAPPPQLVKDFKASGRLDKEYDFSADDKCLAAAK